MKKLLSILCVVALFATCITGNVTATESVVFTDDFFDTEKATYQITSPKDSSTQDAEVPDGWEISTYDSAANFVYNGYFANIKRAVSEWPQTALVIYGSYVSADKIVEIIPGYSYTITTNAVVYKGNSNSKARTEVVLCKGDDISGYTEIAGTAKSAVKNGSEVAELSGVATFYDGTHSVTISATDPEATAIKIKLGGPVGSFDNIFAVYTAVEVTKGEKTGVSVLNEELSSSYTTETIKSSDGNTVYGTAKVPDGWTCSVITAAEAYVNTSSSTFEHTKYASFAWNPCWILYGSYVSFDKIVPISTGYSYKIDVTGAVAKNAPNSRVQVETILLKSDGAGRYTEIEGSSQKVRMDGANNKDGAALAGGCVEVNPSMNVLVTNPEAIAMKIRLGGNVGAMYNQAACYKTVSVSKMAPATKVTYNLEGLSPVEKVFEAGVGDKISLRPVKGFDDSTNVVSTQGYFTGWKLGATSTILSNANGAMYTIPLNSSEINLTAQYANIENNVISGAQAQRATLAGGKNVIRFLALVNNDLANYKEAGFVITTLAKNPTIEAGYRKNGYQNIYKKVNTAGGLLDVTDPSVLAKFTNKGGSLNAAGIVYTNLVIEAANEATTYYATPYVIKEDNSIAYGTTKAISYNELAALDEDVH